MARKEVIRICALSRCSISSELSQQVFTAECDSNEHVEILAQAIRPQQTAIHPLLPIYPDDIERFDAELDEEYQDAMALPSNRYPRLLRGMKAKFVPDTAET